MLLKRSILCVFASIAITPTAFAASSSIQTDILVIGGSFSAPAAALAAARTNPNAQVLLAEPEDWLGGQATVQGVSAIDNAWHSPGAAIMRNDPPSYYPADYLSFLNTIKNKPAAAPGTGMVPNGAAWVTREAFDPRTAAWVLDQMTAAPSNLTVMKMTVAKNVVTETVTDTYGTGKQIKSVTLIQRTPTTGYIPYTKMLSQELKDRYTATDSADFTKTVYTVTAINAAKPLIVIDTSETGDIIVPAGADYTVGREVTTEEIADDNTLPAYEEHGSQATVFVHCMAGVTAATPLNEDSLKTQWVDFDTYYNTQKDYYFKFGAHTWQSIWTYRRIFCDGSTGMYNPNVGDVSMQNWYPGNDYPYGSIYLSKADATSQYNGTDGWYGGLDMEHLATAEKHAVAWYFYMKEKKPSEITWQTRYPHGWDDTQNMMATESGLSKFPYIRCCRRILGIDNFRLMNRYFVDTTKSGYVSPNTSFRFYDSVGIGNYAVDIHPIKGTQGISPTMEKVAPFYLPYRSLASNNIRNLLVGGKQIAGTFLTNAAYRLHPIEWVIGSASGTAAGIMARDNEDNRALLEPTKLHELQNTINTNSPISWKCVDSTVIPPKNGDFIVNEFNNVSARVPFRMEAFGNPQATHGEFFINDISIGISSTKAAGRIVLNNATTDLPSGTYTAKVNLYNESNTILNTLTTQVKVVNASVDRIEKDGIAIQLDPAQGITISVDGNQLSGYSEFYVMSPDWGTQYFSYAQGVFSEISEGIMTSTLTGNTNLFTGSQVIEIVNGDKIRMSMTGKQTSGAVAPLQLYQLSINPDWFAGCDYVLTDTTGESTRGTFLATPTTKNVLISNNMKALTVRTPNGCITISCTGTLNASLRDYRMNNWDDDNLQFLIGNVNVNLENAATFTSAMEMDLVKNQEGYEVPYVIDNGEAGFSTTGTWTTGFSQLNRYGNSYAYSFTPSAPATATWKFSDIPTGQYKVSAFYPNASNRSTQAPFVIKHNGGETTVKIDQINKGGEWVDLGSFDFNSTDGATITLVNDIGSDPNKLVCADAIRIMRANNAEVNMTEWELF